MGFTGRFSNIRISAIATAVPETVVKNDVFLPTQGEESIKKFEKMTGVLERRHSVQLTTRELALNAAIALKDKGHWSCDDVDALIFVSQTPDYQLPATACVLHGQLGIKPDCVAFDVGLGCSGFVYGFYVASNLLSAGSCKKVLLVGGDCISRVAAKSDIANQMLFGDAGFAAVIEADAVNGQAVPYLFGTNGAGAKAIYAKGGALAHSIDGIAINDPALHMDGPDVFNFTISSIPQAIKDFCPFSGNDLASFDHFAFHQANKFILKQIAMLSGFPNSKHLFSIDKFGNTSSASIPLTLCANADKLQGRTMMAGFGVGLSWGVLSYDFTDTNCYPVVEVKELCDA